MKNALCEVTAFINLMLNQSVFSKRIEEWHYIPPFVYHGPSKCAVFNP